MVTIEALKKVDLSKVGNQVLKENIQGLIEAYDRLGEEQFRQLKEGQAQMDKMYQFVQKAFPEAIPAPEEEKPKRSRPPKPLADKLEDAGKEADAERKKAEKRRKEAEKAEQSRAAAQEIDEVDMVEIEQCRRTIREFNKAKREADGTKPVKKSRLTKLKERLLGLAALMPDKFKKDRMKVAETEEALLDTLFTLQKAWEMNKVDAATEAIKEKFEEMEDKIAEQEEKEEQQREAKAEKKK